MPRMNYPTTFDEAVAFEKHAQELVAKNKEANKKPRSEETLATLHAVQALLPKGKYKHFKGGGYEVFDVVEDVNTGECYVRYAGDYGVYKGEIALRILVGEDSFLRPIERDTYKGVRFEKL